MFILEFLSWVLDNPGDATVGGVLLLFARNIVLAEIGRVFQMARDEELIWTREHVERIVGEKWSGPRPILKRVRIRYIVSYYSYLLAGSKWVCQLKRRGRKMQLNKAWLSGVIAYFLGQAALKYGFTFKVEWADMAADIIFTFIIPMIVAWMNRTKEAKPNGNAGAANTIGSSK